MPDGQRHGRIAVPPVEHDIADVTERDQPFPGSGSIRKARQPRAGKNLVGGFVSEERNNYYDSLRPLTGSQIENTLRNILREFTKKPRRGNTRRLT